MIGLFCEDDGLGAGLPDQKAIILRACDGTEVAAWDLPADLRILPG